MIPEVYDIDGFQRRRPIPSKTPPVIDADPEIIEISDDSDDDDNVNPTNQEHSPSIEIQVKKENFNEQSQHVEEEYGDSNETTMFCPNSNFDLEAPNASIGIDDETLQNISTEIPSPKSQSDRISRPSVSSGFESIRSHRTDSDDNDDYSPNSHLTSKTLNSKQTALNESTPKVLYSTKSKGFPTSRINEPPPSDIFDDVTNDAVDQNTRMSTSHTQNFKAKNEEENSFNRVNYAEQNQFSVLFPPFSAQNTSNFEQNLFSTPTRLNYECNMTPHHGGVTPMLGPIDLKEMIAKVFDDSLEKLLENRNLVVVPKEEYDSLKKNEKHEKNKHRVSNSNKNHSKRHSSSHSDDKSNLKRHKFESSHAAKPQKIEQKSNKTTTTSTITSGNYVSDMQNINNMEFNSKSNLHNIQTGIYKHFLVESIFMHIQYEIQNVSESKCFCTDFQFKYQPRAGLTATIQRFHPKETTTHAPHTGK